MKLSAADRKWLRAEIRRIVSAEVASLVSDAAEQQLGGYDGATPVIEDEWADEGKKAARPRVGFVLP